MLDSPEFFRNMKSIPDEKSSEYRAFFLNELDKITYGVTINGVYIHGWLYFHWNHWKIYQDMVDSRNGDIRRIFGLSQMRDNEWIIAEHLHKAEQEKKGLMIFGSRRLGKSVSESSWIGRGAVIYEGSENVISSTNSQDLIIVTDLIDRGMNGLHPFFKHSRIKDDWRREVVFGIKDKSGTRYEYSKIAIRNLDGGKNTEAFAGLTPKTLIIDEALEQNELVYTENDKIPIKDIKIGDFIYDESGELVKVIDKIDPGIVDIYEFTLSDGRKIKSSYNHIWRVYNTYLKKYVDLTSEEINNKYFFYKKDKRYDKINKSYIFSIQQNDPINYPKKNLKIDPYWLGLWLGYGSKNNTSIYTEDKEIVDYCIGYSTRLNLDYSITNIEDKADGNFKIISIVNKKRTGNILRKNLKKYGLFGNKFIPKEYLYSSIEDRMSLLQGLMDTDGSVDKIGHIEFVSSRIEIVKGMEELLQGLGISFYVKKCTKKFSYKGIKKEGKCCWRFYIYTDKKIFRLKRKLNNYNINYCSKSKAYKTRSTIIDIKYAGKSQAYCIKVNNKSHLFLTTGAIVTHNCGKEKFGEAFESAKPAFTSPFGWRCVPIIAGTGGTLKEDSDAEKYFKHPEHHNFLPVFIEEKGKSYGLFISGSHRMEAKVETTFGKYLKNRHGILVPEGSELDITPFFDSDEALAKEITQKELDAAIKDNDPKAYLKQRMYFPEDPDDCFLTDDGNEFPLDALREHLDYLERGGDPAEYVILERTASGRISPKPAEAGFKPIVDFPVTKSTRKTAPVQIWEHPIKEVPPIGLYIAGADPYNQNVSDNSPSLGTVYVYKRMYDLIGGTFQDQIVASLASRPSTMKEWHNDVESLLDYYNAICMPENEGTTFIQHFDQRNKAHMLADGYQLTKQISPKTTTSGRIKGLPATTAVKKFYMSLMLEYCKEEIFVENSKGEKVSKMGLVRIPDPLLIREMLSYRDSGGNYDRLVAFGHALACNIYFNKIYPKVKFQEEESEDRSQVRVIRSPFNFGSHSPFNLIRK